MVSTLSIKNLEKSEKCHLLMLKKLIFDLNVASKLFFAMHHTKYFFLNNFKVFVFLSRKMGSTLSLKHLHKSEKFHSLRTFIFHLKVALKLFSEMLPIIKF